MDATRTAGSAAQKPNKPVDQGAITVNNKAKAAKAAVSAPKQLDSVLTLSRAVQGPLARGDSADTPKATCLNHVAGKLGKPAGALGVVAGCAQSVAAAHELTHGDARHGLEDAVSGGTTVAAGIAALAKSRLAGPLAGVASIISGASQLKDAKNRDDRIVGASKVAGGGTLVTAGALEAAGVAADATVLGAPLGLALNAAGALMLGAGAGYQYRCGIETAVKKVGHWLGFRRSG